MPRLPIALSLVSALLIAAPLAADPAAAPAPPHCRVASEWQLRIGRDELVFSRAAARPAEVRIVAGAIAIDGVLVPSPGPTREVIVRFEDEVRALLPELRRWLRATTDALLGAIERHALAMVPRDSPNWAAIRAELKTLRVLLAVRIDHMLDGGESLRADLFDRMIADAAARVAPLLLREVAGAALDGLFGSPSEAPLRERLVAVAEARVAAASARAAALCERLSRLDRLEAQIVSGLPEAQRFDVVVVQRGAPAVREVEAVAAPIAPTPARPTLQPAAPARVSHSRS